MWCDIHAGLFWAWSLQLSVSLFHSSMWPFWKPHSYIQDLHSKLHYLESQMSSACCAKITTALIVSLLSYNQSWCTCINTCVTPSQPHQKSPQNFLGVFLLHKQVYRNSFVSIDFCTTALDNCLAPKANAAGLGSQGQAVLLSLSPGAILPQPQPFVASHHDLELTWSCCIQIKEA